MVNFSRSFARPEQDSEESQVLRPVSPVSSGRGSIPAMTSPQPARSSAGSTPHLSRDSSGVSEWNSDAYCHESIPLDDYLHNSSDISELNVLGLSQESVGKRQSVIRRVPVGSKGTVTPQSSNNDIRGSWGRDTLLSSPETLVGSPPPQSHRRHRWSGFASFKNRIQHRRSGGFEMLKSNVASISEVERDGLSQGGHGNDPELFRKLNEPASFCSSKRPIQEKRNDCLSVTIIVLSLYSTIMSGLWLVVALVQPRWGRQISSKHGLQPSTATVLATWIAKTIEMSFVALVVTFLGQVHSRRAISRVSRGMTLSEASMRSWVIQPGSLFTHFEMVRFAGPSVLGVLAILASLTAMMYTTASDAMVSPKLKYGRWEHKQLSGYVRSSYANSGYLQETCPGMLDDIDKDESPTSCMNVQLSGESYRNLMSYMQAWTDIYQNGSSLSDQLQDRPTGTALLHGNTTLVSSWIETQHSNVTELFEKTGKLINNVTLAMPHPGVASAATLPLNHILQPDDLSGVGEYAVRAGAVSPTVNAMCVNVSPEELSPLIYTEWPESINNATGVGDQLIGWKGWHADAPDPIDEKNEKDYLNRTYMDDVFKWGPDHGRWPPVFQLFPADYNIIINSTVYMSDALYLLGKGGPAMANYTLCELRSWLSPNCSTHFNVSLKTGNKLSTHCEDPTDLNSYLKSFDKEPEWSLPSTDWRWLANQWQLAANLNGGTQNNNASNARILTQLALTTPQLPSYLPSLAEALAVFASSTIITGSVGTPFRHYWEYEKPGNILGDPGVLQQFNASVVTQEYTSGHVDSWQGTFYLFLILAFLINLFCALYFFTKGGLVTDFTEAQNLCALAINSPASEQLKGSCGGGPQGRDLVVPWRIAYASGFNHYFLKEAEKAPWKGTYVGEQAAAGQGQGEVPASSAAYRRLSTRRAWL